MRRALRIDACSIENSKLFEAETNCLLSSQRPCVLLSNSYKTYLRPGLSLHVAGLPQMAVSHGLQFSMEGCISGAQQLTGRMEGRRDPNVWEGPHGDVTTLRHEKVHLYLALTCPRDSAAIFPLLKVRPGECVPDSLS